MTDMFKMELGDIFIVYQGKIIHDNLFVNLFTVIKG